MIPSLSSDNMMNDGQGPIDSAGPRVVSSAQTDRQTDGQKVLIQTPEEAHGRKVNEGSGK
jgi:hypothetical protein